MFSDEAVQRVQERVDPLIADHLARVEAILRTKGTDELEIAAVLAERAAEMAEWRLAAFAAAERDLSGTGAN